jgi:hypothetical protein
VTEAVTVVAQREPVVTVVAPRETPSEAAAAPRPRTPPAIGKAVDADGDGIADAPAGAARTGTTGRPSGKRSPAATSAKPGPDCDDKDASATSKAACSQSNPIYKDKAAQGQNPLHVP